MTKSLSLEMLPALHGDALWLEYGSKTQRRKILIDGGPIGAWKALDARLAAAGDDKFFELVVLTHIDTDHAEGLIRLFADWPLRIDMMDAWFNGWHHLEPNALGGRQGEFFSALLSVRRNTGTWNDAFGGGAVVVPEEGPLPEVHLAGGMHLTLLSPSPAALEKLKVGWDKAIDGKIAAGDLESALEALRRDKKYLPSDGLVLGPPRTGDALYKDFFKPDASAANGSSIAFLAEWEGRSLLLLGDAHAPVIEASLQRLLEARGEDRLQVDAVKLAHHGSKKNLRPSLLDLIDAKYFLFSTNGDKFGHPSPEAVNLVIDHRMPRPPVLCFNYHTETTRAWSTPEDQAARNYSAMYPIDEGEAFRLVLSS